MEPYGLNEGACEAAAFSANTWSKLAVCGVHILRFLHRMIDLAASGVELLRLTGVFDP
ncbi:hypothetical protein [Mesorhizobium loti]|uniref:hypothetical protein n=1 Tax=Rhizobium loti TaxID=381 RepID=UPI001474F598|nr:hypothetical protein [Mesorhizobium loti]